MKLIYKPFGIVLGILAGFLGKNLLGSKFSFDIHVHRITNRWGFVHTPTPDATRAALEQKLPEKYWVDINALLVPFGKNICTPIGPKCSICPLLDMCEQRGVSSPR